MLTLTLGLYSVAATSQSLATTTMIPPCGAVLLNNAGFMVSAYSYLAFNESEAILADAGWNASVSSVIAGCGGSLTNGSFVPVNQTQAAECRKYIERFGAQGVCWEARIYVDSPAQMQAAASNATAIAAHVAAYTQEMGLSGVSFDWEKRGENKRSHHHYLNVTRTLQMALATVGVRVSSFSNNFYHDILSFKDLSYNNDKVLCGETYKGSQAKWREQWHRLVTSPARAKLSPVLSANTKHGSENCSPNIIGNRTLLLKQNFTEISVFSLNAPGEGHQKGGCFAKYIPFLKAFRSSNTNAR